MVHQLFMIDMGVEAPGLHLCQCRLSQGKVPLLLIEHDLLLPQYLIEAEGVLDTGGVNAHLAEVLLMSSLSFCLFSVKVGDGLHKGLLFLCDKGLIPPSQLLQLLCCCRCHRGSRRMGGPTYIEHQRSSSHREASLTTARGDQNPTCSP
jgi:hypothetical protein